MNKNNKKQPLEDYKTYRHTFCKLVDNKAIDVYKHRKEVKMFKKLYKSNGANCPYLLALTKAIHITNPELFSRLTRINGK